MAQTSKPDPALAFCRIGPGRLSFPYLFEARETDTGSKYSATILLPPGYNTAPILAALVHAAECGFGKDRSKWPPKMRAPEDVIRKAEEKSQFAGYEPGWLFITASGQDQPGVVNGMREKVTDPKEVYAGRWANLGCSAFWFRNKTVGVSLGLNNVQLLRNDSTFGRRNARQDFDDVVEEMQEEGGFV